MSTCLYCEKPMHEPNAECPRPYRRGSCPNCELFDCIEDRGICVYEPCGNPKCGQYFIEHTFSGHKSRVVYSKNPEEVGREIEWEDGCMSCEECTGFVFPSEEVEKRVRALWMEDNR